MKHAKTILLVFSITVLFLLASCATPYPNMRTHDYENAFVYEMGNLSADTLVISIEGSGWASTLGRKWLGIWLHTSWTSIMLQPLKRENAFLVPEKWKRNPKTNAGLNSGIYYDDLYLRSIYTIENLVDMYAESINLYLADNRFRSVFIVGFSEGAIVMPLLYAKIDGKEKIKGIVSIAGGGLPMYDSYSLLSTAKITPRAQREAYAYAIENYETESDAWHDSVGVNKYGTVLCWLASVMEFEPFEYWRNIDIPVLFIHGEKDFNVAVESTRYIQENLSEKPFEFIYYKNMAHTPNSFSPFYYFQIFGIRNDIAKWIRKVQAQ